MWLCVSTFNYTDHHDWISKRASQIAMRYNIDPEDAQQDAYFGFLKAVERFDENKGASFRTFASYKIFGTIVDEHRKRTWFGRCHIDVIPCEFEVKHESGYYDDCDIDFERKIANTPAESRHYIALRFVVDMNSTEIGKACGVPSWRVRDRFKIVKQELRSHLCAPV